MKKIVSLFFASLILMQSFAAVNLEVPVRKASEIYFPLGNTGKMISLLELTTMSAKEFSTLTGQNLKFKDKLAFKITQKELKKVINRDGTVNAKKLESLNKKMQKAAIDNKGNLRWALILLGTGVVLSLLGLAVPFVWILAYIAYLGATVFFIIWLVNMAK